MKTAGTALAILLVTAAVGCGSAGGGSTVPRDSESLSREEIQASGQADAYDLVQALRPRWLGTRGSTSITRPQEVKVYVDGLLMGGPESLRQLSIQDIQSMRFHDGIDATQRWGTDHGQGAIVVSTRGAR